MLTVRTVSNSSLMKAKSHKLMLTQLGSPLPAACQVWHRPFLGDSHFKSQILWCCVTLNRWDGRREKSETTADALFISQSLCVKLLWLECQQCLGCGSEIKSIFSVPRQISENPKTQLSWFLTGFVCANTNSSSFIALQPFGGLLVLPHSGGCLMNPKLLPSKLGMSGMRGHYIH